MRQACLNKNSFTITRHLQHFLPEMLVIYVKAGLLAWLIFPPSRPDRFRGNSGKNGKILKSDTVAGTAAGSHGNSLFTLLIVSKQDTITGQI